VGLEGKLTVERLSILGNTDRGLTLLNQLLLFHTHGHTKRAIIFELF
jgi:hypothetical protein